LAQDANGLNYFLLPFQASRAMKTGVVATNGHTHRTYRKSAIAPNLLLQANAASTGGFVVKAKPQRKSRHRAWPC